MGGDLTVSALPRPDLPPGPLRDLVADLHDLHHRDGWRSLRTLARATGVSHTTVSKAFSSGSLPSWGTVELLVEAMGGDRSHFHDRWLAASATDGRAPLVPRIAGRARELACVRRHLGSGAGLLLVLGEAGMGKTKLLATATELVAEECFVATGSSLPLSSAVPMLPMADALQIIHDSDGGEWFAHALSGAEPYVAASVRRLVPAVARFGAAVELPDDDWSRHHLFAAVAATIRALRSIRPLALVFEDLHWADAATLDLLEHLSSREVSVPFIGSYRTDDPATPATTADWLGRVRRLPRTTTLGLLPLSPDETAEQLSLLLGRRAHSVRVADIHARAQGLPLFTEQLARALDLDGDQPMPGLLGDLLDSRLAGLGGRAWVVARVLGVADRGLPSAVVMRAGGLSRDELIEGLQTLDGRRLLLSAADSDVAQLRHPLLAEAIRRRLVAGEGVEQHRDLARALAAEPDPAAAEVALHWQRGRRPDEEVAWRVSAARAAADRFSATEEIVHWRRVITLYSEGHEAPDGLPLDEVYCAAIDAAWTVGLRRESEEIVSEAVSALTALEGRARADLCFRIATRSMAGYTAESRTLADEAIAIYRTLAPRVDLALCLERRSVMLRQEGRWDEAARDLDEAAEVCSAIGAVGTRRWIVARRAWLAGMMGDRAAATRGISDAFALELPSPDPSGDIRLGTAATDYLLQCGGSVDDVLAAAAPGLAAADAWSAAVFAGTMLRANVVEALIRAGRVTDAADVLDRATTRPGVTDLWLTRLSLTELATAQGRLDDAADQAAALLGEDDASLDYRAETCLAAARVDMWRGRPAAALDRLVPLLAEAVTTDKSRALGPHFVLAARAAADCVHDASQAVARPTAAEHLALLRELLHAAAVAPFGDRSALADAGANEASWRAELARLAGTQSVADWVAPAAAWDVLDRPHDAAYCRWRAAQVALGAGHAATAVRLLRRATSQAREHEPLTMAIAETAHGAVDPGGHRR
jgi:hypothetical protein